MGLGVRGWRTGGGSLFIYLLKIRPRHIIFYFMKWGVRHCNSELQYVLDLILYLILYLYLYL